MEMEMETNIPSKDKLSRQVDPDKIAPTSLRVSEVRKSDRD